MLISHRKVAFVCGDKHTLTQQIPIAPNVIEVQDQVVVMLHSLALINHVRKKLMSVEDSVELFIGNFSNCPSASIHRADYWSDIGEWSNASSH